MAGFGFDLGVLKAEGAKGDMYVVLHTISTASSGSKGFLGGDKI